GVRGHPVPGLRREVWCGGFDEFMEPLSGGAILRRHRGDRGAHGAFPIRSVLQLSGARFHRGLFLGRESFFLVGALGGLLLAFLRRGAHPAPFVRSTTCAKRSSRCSHVLMPSKAYGASMHLRTRPTFSVVTSSASSSSRMCFFIPVSDMPKGSASSLIVAWPDPSRSRTERRVGSARAAKARSTAA